MYDIVKQKWKVLVLADYLHANDCVNEEDEEDKHTNVWEGLKKEDFKSYYTFTKT